jgi:hypothetical protein
MWDGLALAAAFGGVIGAASAAIYMIFLFIFNPKARQLFIKSGDTKISLGQSGTIASDLERLVEHYRGEKGQEPSDAKAAPTAQKDH